MSDDTLPDSFRGRVKGVINDKLVIANSEREYLIPVHSVLRKPMLHVLTSFEVYVSRDTGGDGQYCAHFRNGLMEFHYHF